MNPEEIYKRTDTLSKACIKVALLMKINTAVDGHCKAELVRNASEMAIKSRSLMVSQIGRFFVERLNVAAEHATACGYWLEHIEDQGLMDVAIIRPLIKECDQLYRLFLLSAKSASDKINQE